MATSWPIREEPSIARAGGISRLDHDGGAIGVGRLVGSARSAACRRQRGMLGGSTCTAVKVDVAAMQSNDSSSRSATSPYQVSLRRIFLARTPREPTFVPRKVFVKPQDLQHAGLRP